MTSTTDNLPADQTKIQPRHPAPFVKPPNARYEELIRMQREQQQQQQSQL